MLKKLVDTLPRGSRTKLALRLGCNLSKITLALYGMVKSEEFMAQLEEAAIELSKEYSL